jgi:hypothetical protein
MIKTQGRLGKAEGRRSPTDRSSFTEPPGVKERRPRAPHPDGAAIKCGLPPSRAPL